MIHITKIYLVTNCYNDPNKVYIGKTKNTRKSNHKRKFGNQITYDYIDEIFSLNKNEWEPLETYWIEQFRQWGFNIQNKNKGGGGPETHSDKTKSKMKKVQTGNKYNLGKKWTDEHKLNMSLSKIGKPKPEGFSEKMSKIKLAQNIKFSEEHKQKISESKKGNKYNLGKIRSEETKQKISKSMIGKNKRNK